MIGREDFAVAVAAFRRGAFVLRRRREMAPFTIQSSMPAAQRQDQMGFHPGFTGKQGDETLQIFCFGRKFDLLTL